MGMWLERVRVLFRSEVERMAHWSAYGSRVFSSPGSIFARLIHSAFTMTHRRGIEPRSIIGETRVHYWSVVWSLPELFSTSSLEMFDAFREHSTHLHGAVDGH